MIKKKFVIRPSFNRIFVKSLWVLLLLTCLTAAAFTEDGELFFTGTPTVSPDGKKMVFSYAEDLWIVDSSGGTAYRLTAMQGRELNPRFSPDGRWLAFSGSSVGSFDVYVMPVAGGTIRQLTFHDSEDIVDSWSPDSNHIYFFSRRSNSFTEYKINAAGGTPQRLFHNYFNTVHGVVEHPLTGALYFTDTWESRRFANRKRYKGDFNPDIKSYNPETKEYKVHTTYRGKDFSPTIDKHGNIYFVSDRDNDEYNLFTFKNEKVVRLTNFPTSIYAPCVSANGNLIVFEKDYQLFSFDVKTGETKKINIVLFKHDSLARSRDFNVNGKITHFDISGDGKKIALISRGELFVSHINGKFIRHIAASANSERVMEVKWLQDDKTLLFTRTTRGWLNIFKIRVDTGEPAVQLTFDRANNRNIILGSNRSRALYLSGRNDLKLLDLKTFKSETIVKDEFWGFYSSQPFFSPDERYVVYAAFRNFEKDIFVHHLESGKTVNLTDSGLTETDPYWSPDGKYIFFAADREDASYPRGGNKDKIYRLGLQKYDKEYKVREFEKLFREKNNDNDQSKKKTKNEKPTIAFDYENMAKRWELVSPAAGGQGQPYVISDNDTYTVLYISNHDGEKDNLWKTTITPFEKDKTEKIAGAEVGDLIISRAGETYYILKGGVINELNLSGNSLKPVKMDFTFRRNLSAEFSQMFYEVWANLYENFYDDAFHGVDWLKIRQRYERFLPHIRGRADLRRLIGDMLGELNSSHLGFNSSGDEEKTFYKIYSLHTGIIFEENRPYVVKDIAGDSAADKKGINIKPGDVLTAVNDQKVDQDRNREYYFTAPSPDREMKLTFNSGNRSYNVLIHPEDNNSFKRHLYDEWIQANQDHVDRVSGSRIAYVHMKNMGGNELKNFFIEMTTEAFKKEGLILDLRYNTGGNVHDAVLNFLSRRPYTRWKYRGGEFAPQPNFAPSAKPIVLLVNEQSLSDAEMTAAGFKALRLGKVIGTETYRWLIFTSGKGLVDGSFYRLPSWGCYTLDGKDIEMHGVKPDIYIKKTFKDRLEGKYPQLDRAIADILHELEKK